MGGQIFNDRYRLVGMIGEGGMAIVYRALDQRLARFVALKVLRPKGTLAAGKQQAFLQEGRALAALAHSNIVPVYDVGIDKGRAFLVMELVSGPTLRERLSAGPLHVAEASYVAERLASALAAIHAQQLLHLDVKPENVLFDERNQPKLADLGISRTVGDDPVREDGTILGTLPYLAPEYLQGEPLDARADLFALGVVLYEMLTAVRPFAAAATADQIIPQLAHTAPPSPDQLNPLVPEWLAKIVLQAIAPNPSDRIASAAAFQDALHMHAQTSTQPTRVPVIIPSGVPAHRAAVLRPPLATGRTPAWVGRWLAVALLLLVAVFVALSRTDFLPEQAQPLLAPAAASRETRATATVPSVPSNGETVMGDEQPLADVVPPVPMLPLSPSPTPSPAAPTATPAHTPTTTSTPVGNDTGGDGFEEDDVVVASGQVEEPLVVLGQMEEQLRVDTDDSQPRDEALEQAQEQQREEAKRAEERQREEEKREEERQREEAKREKEQQREEEKRAEERGRRN